MSENKQVDQLLEKYTMFWSNTPVTHKHMGIMILIILSFFSE